MADVHTGSARVRKFYQTVKFRSLVVVHSLKDTGLVPFFLPFGFFLPMASKYRSFFAAVFYSFTLSLCVETFQLLTKVGSFDVDDLLLNTIGGVAGYIIFVICAAVRRRHVRLSTRKRR